MSVAVSQFLTVLQQKATFLVNVRHKVLSARINYLTFFAFLFTVLSLFSLSSNPSPSYYFCYLPPFSEMKQGFSHPTDVCPIARYITPGYPAIPFPKIDFIRNNSLRSLLLSIFASAYFETATTLNTKPSVL